MFLFKTKLRAALSSSTIVLTGYAAYDRYITDQVKSSLLTEASVYSNMPMDIHDLPRKVLVYTAPSQYAAYNFKQFVKPVFDAAALDYELVLIEKSGDVHDKIRDLLWTAKDEASTRPELSIEDTESSLKKKPRTWSEFLFGSSGNRMPPIDPIQEFLSRPKYSPHVALIAMGPEAWDEMMQGMLEGCFSKRSSEQVSTEESSQDSVDGEEKSVTLDASNMPLATPNHQPVLTFNTLDLPPLGYISAKNLVGMTKFPQRIFAWFHQRHAMQEMGSRALEIVHGHTHAIRDAKNKYPDMNLPDEIASRIVFYVGRE